MNVVQPHVGGEAAEAAIEAGQVMDGDTRPVHHDLVVRRRQPVPNNLSQARFPGG
jgi:hypothetical protein